MSFAEFYRFVRHKDKREFDCLCKELTGEGCGYKPEDSVPKKRAQSEASNTSGSIQVLHVYHSRKKNIARSNFVVFKK